MPFLAFRSSAVKKSMEWNVGMEHWNGTLEWNTGMNKSLLSRYYTTVHEHYTLKLAVM